MKISDIETARAVIAHEAVDCFLGNEESPAPQPSHLVSGTGGVFWGKSGESWPTTAAGQPLMPWLQVVCAEIKGAGGPFHRRQTVCFFLNPEFHGAEAVSDHNVGDFVVREYLRDDRLEPLRMPADAKSYDFRAVKWRKHSDYPSISKYGELFDDTVYSALCDDERLEFVNRSGIKIGGWPTPIQSSQQYPGAFDLQIDMTENYSYGDSGIGYLSANDGKWYLMFDCC